MSDIYESVAQSRLSLVFFRMNVRTLRMKLKLSKSYMAKKCDMTFKSYSKFEQGETFPKGDNLIAIAYALGCTYEQLSTDVIPQVLPKVLKTPPKSDKVIKYLH